MAAAGQSIVGGNFVGDVGANAANTAFIIAHETVLARMTKSQGTPSATPPARASKAPCTRSTGFST